MEIQINYLAVLVAVVANFFLGFLWYTPLFGKAWARELGVDMSIKPKASEMARGLIFNIIGNFFLAYVFAHNMAAWEFVPEANEMSAASTILSSAIFTWLGFFLPVDINTVAWERKSWKFFFINTTYHFLLLLVAATIFTLMD